MSFGLLRPRGEQALLFLLIALAPSIAFAQPAASPPPPTTGDAPLLPSEPPLPPSEPPPPAPGEPTIPPPEAPPPPPVSIPTQPPPATGATPSGYLPPPTVFPDPVSAVSPPLRLPTSHWDLALGATASNIASSYYYGRGGDSYPLGDRTAWSGGGFVTVTRYLDPVTDDATPRSLQPFLQHTGAIFFAVGADGTTGEPLSGASPGSGAFSVKPTFSEVHVAPVVGVDAYVTRAWAITGGFRFDYDETFPSDGGAFNHQVLSPNLGVGLHLADTRVDLSYEFQAFARNGDFVSPQWGQLSLGVQSVFAKRVSLTAAGRAFDAGGGASAGVETFINKSIGVFLDGFADAHRRFIDDDVAYNQYGLDVGAAFWVIPRLRLQARYAISWLNVPNEDLVLGRTVMRNQLLLGGLVRL